MGCCTRAALPRAERWQKYLWGCFSSMCHQACCLTVLGRVEYRPELLGGCSWCMWVYTQLCSSVVSCFGKISHSLKKASMKLFFASAPSSLGPIATSSILTIKEAPQRADCVIGVAEILSGSRYVPTSNATEKETGSVSVVSKHRKSSIIFPRAHTGWQWSSLCFHVLGGSATLLEAVERISLASEGWSFPQAELRTSREYLLMIKRMCVVGWNGFLVACQSSTTVIKHACMLSLVSVGAAASQGLILPTCHVCFLLSYLKIHWVQFLGR